MIQLLELGYVFLHGDLTDKNMGIATPHMKLLPKFKNNTCEEELTMLKILVEVSKEVDSKRLQPTLEKMTPVFGDKNVKSINIHRLMLGLVLLQRHSQLHGKTLRHSILHRLIGFVRERVLESNEKGRKHFVLRDTIRLVKTIEHFILTNEILNIQLPMDEWIIATDSIIQEKEISGMLINQFAKHMKVPSSRVKNWIKKGWIVPLRDSENKRIINKSMLFCEFEYV